MTALKSAEIDRFVAKPNPSQPVVLVFGPDSGLVRERVDALVRASVDDPADPFALARIEGDELSSNPARLAEEAHTVPLFGGRRAVWVRAGSRNIAPAVEAVIDSGLRDCRVIIEAGDLKKSSPLRAVCEKAKSAAALPCYADSERDLARLVDDEMSAAGLTLAPDARDTLVSLVGGDRLASRSELRKLALYAQGKDRVELDDIFAVVADASALGVDGVIDAAFGGRTADVETQFGKAQAVSAPGAIVGAALRHVSQLHKMRLAMDQGADAESAMRSVPPPMHFRRQPLIASALRNWTSPRLLRAMDQLATALFETRKSPDLAETIAHRALLSLAVNARKRA